MNLVPFVSIFPEIAEQETRSILVLDDDKMPKGHYGFVEYYCPESDCDCRMVCIKIISDESDEIFADISCGWESKAFYNNYFEHTYHGLPGPAFSLLQPQGEYAEHFLDLFKMQWELLSYKDRLIKHYNMVKQEARVRDVTVFPKLQPARAEKVPGRNESCFCNSGLKYKKCCIAKKREPEAML